MSKEQQELVDKAYENYSKEYEKDNSIGMCLLVKRLDGKSTYRKPKKEMFVDLCKYDKTFSEKWGLKIEERKLSWEERRDLLTPEQYDGTALNKYGHKDCGFGDISPFTDKVIHYWMNLHNIPTKLITITYNDQKVESYE